MLSNGAVAICLLFTLRLLIPVAPQDVSFTEFIVSSGYRSNDVLPTNRQHYAANRDECATLCWIDGACVAAFFGKSQKQCVTLSNNSQAWTAASEWDALVKGGLFTAAPNTVYDRMVGSAYTPAGTPAARRVPYGLAVDANHCQLMCDGASTPCNIFGYSSSTRQCMLFDLKSTAAVAPTDSNLYTYYRYTTVNYTTAGNYIYAMLANDLSNVSWIAFSVQACSDAHLTLQPSSSAVNSYAYEFAIGGWSNTLTCLRRQLGNVCYAQASNTFLNCNSPRQMWVSWIGGLIRFGTGNVVGENIAISYQDPSPYPVTAFGLTGWGGATGVWSVHIPLWN